MVIDWFILVFKRLLDPQAQDDLSESLSLEAGFENARIDLVTSISTS